MPGEYRGSISHVGYRIEGISKTGTNPATYMMNQTNSDVGTLTGYSTGVLNNTNASWITDTWKGAKVFVFDSTKDVLKGFSRVISNTATALTVGIESGSDLDTTANSPIVESLGSTFQSNGIKAGDFLYISSGSDIGTYVIYSVDSETQLTLTQLMTATSTESFTTGFSSTPGSGDAYWIDSRGMPYIQGSAVNDIGVTFNSAVELPDPEIEWIGDMAVGDNREVSIFTQGKYTLHGTLSGRLRVPRLISFALGKEVVTGASAPYLHEMSVATILPSFLLEGVLEDTPDFVRYFEGCKVNSLKLTGGQDEPLNVEAEIYAFHVDDGTVKSIVVRDQNAGNYKSAETYMFSESFFDYFGRPYACMESWELTINNNLDEQFCSDPTKALYPAKAFEGNAEYDLKATIRPIDKQVWNEQVNPTSGGGTVNISFTRFPAFDYLNLQASGCVQVSAPHNIPEGALSVDVALKPKSLTATSLDQYDTYWK